MHYPCDVPNKLAKADLYFKRTKEHLLSKYLLF